MPRDGRICLDISYIGLMDLAMSTGAIRWAQAELVYAADAFSLNGFDKPPTHSYNPFAKDRGEVIGVYVVVKTADGDYLTETMSIEDVNAIRDRSSAWKAWVSKNKSCPWVTDPGEMAKKTVVKRGYKYWPKTERLEQAIHHLNTDGGEGLASVVGSAPTDPEMVNNWISLAQKLHHVVFPGGSRRATPAARHNVLHSAGGHAAKACREPLSATLLHLTPPQIRLRWAPPLP